VGYEYEHREEQGAVLTVNFDPEEEGTKFKFDFESKDPVEEVARLAQGLVIEGSPAPLEEGVDTIMRVIIEAAESIN